MISICIPIYNFDSRRLIDQLTHQANELNVPSQIIIIDDCSDIEFKNLNEQTCLKSQYIQLEYNIGRAKIRNLFLTLARFDHLLFIDCDSILPSENFLFNYVEAIKQNFSVICGGTIYDHKIPERSKILRWRYGIKKESIPVQERINPKTNSFMANNFVVSKKILENIKFDERLNAYGHEDTLFGYQLKKNGIIVHQIENPVIHNDIENNSKFLSKTETAIQNLIRVFDLVGSDPEFIKSVTLIRFYFKIKALKLDRITYLAFIIFRRFIKHLIINGYSPIFLFDFYKLGLFIQNYEHSK